MIYGHPCLAQNCPQGAAIQFRMIRHNNLCKRFPAPKDPMASMLPQYNESGCGQRFHAGSS